MTIKISVVVPVYNRPAELYRALSSVLSQTYTDYEVIVIDDGSAAEESERISQIVNSIGDDRFSLIALPQNRGGAYARNVGVENSIGDFIAFLDSDDEWMPRKLEMDVVKLQSPPCDLVYSQIKNVEDGVIKNVVPKKAISPNQRISDYLFCCNKGGKGMQTSTLVVRRDIAIRKGFNPELRGHQDWEFLLGLDDHDLSIGFVPHANTIRHLSSLGDGHVHRGLDYHYSATFLEQHKHLMTDRSIAMYASRVLLPKEISEGRFSVGNVSFRLFLNDPVHISKQLIKHILLQLKENI